MRVNVRLFALAGQLAGKSLLAVEVPAGTTVAGLRQELARQVPQLGAIMPRVLFAVDAEYASDDRTLDDKSEVACIPPVSGG